MAQINWSKRAIRDLETVFQLISEDSHFYAYRFTNKIILKVDQLLEFPESGRIVPEKEDVSIRELIEGNYRIFYKWDKNQVTILRIHNSARKII
jgi:toxin ParE1/3/4